jgi:hypothetical protein
VRSCERVTLTRVVVAEGMGVDGNPVREVTYWYDDDGWLIARRDGWEELLPAPVVWVAPVIGRPGLSMTLLRART